MWRLGLLLSVAIAEDPSPDPNANQDAPLPVLNDTDEALYKRLLEDNQPRILTPQEESPVDSELDLPWWGYPLGLCAILALGVMVRRQGVNIRSPEKVKVLSRATLGRDGSLAVIEAPSTNGAVRRMLIGYGSGSAPRLVADLGAQSDIGLEASDYKPLDMVIEDDDDLLSQREDMINSVLAARKRNARAKSTTQAANESNDDPWVRDFQKLLAEQLNDDDT